jgi:hypothetical protein
MSARLNPDPHSTDEEFKLGVEILWRPTVPRLSAKNRLGLAKEIAGVLAAHRIVAQRQGVAALADEIRAYLNASDDSGARLSYGELNRIVDGMLQD